MKFLSYDGPLAQTIRVIWRYLILNLCFILCSLPILTIGAATAALYTVMLPAPEETGYVKKYFLAFRSNFSHATTIWIVILIPLLLLLVSFYLTLVFPFPGNNLFRVFEIVLLVIVMSLVSFAFPLQARYDNPPKTTIRNAFVLCIGAFLPGLLMSVITLLPAFVFLIDTTLFIRLIAFWHFFGFALTARINSTICMFIFSKLDPAPADEQQLM